MEPRLYTKYKKELVPSLKEELKKNNVMQIPKLEKVMVSMCLKEATTDIKVLEKGMKEVAQITGQQPKMTRAKKAIAGFKLREGVPLGCVTTLRGARMWEFVDRFVSVALPRVRDFRGISPKGFDGRGNYSTGLKEQIIFPEINYDKVEKSRGMNVTFVTSAQNDNDGRALLTKLGLPFREKN